MTFNGQKFADPAHRKGCSTQELVVPSIINMIRTITWP